MVFEGGDYGLHPNETMIKKVQIKLSRWMWKLQLPKSLRERWLKHWCDWCGRTNLECMNWTSMVYESKFVNLCEYCFKSGGPVDLDFIEMTPEMKRARHWGEIKARVTTHEGQVLSGKAGRDYQRRYGKKYLGRDIGASGFSVDKRIVQEFEATKK